MTPYMRNAKIQQNSLKTLLKNIGFKDAKTVRYDNKQGDIDVVVRHNDTLIVFECKSGSTNLQAELNGFKGKIEKMREFLESRTEYRGCTQFRFVYYVSGRIPNDQKLRKNASTSPTVYLLDQEELHQIQKLSKHLKEGIRYDFLEKIGVKPDKSESLEFPAIEVPLNDGGKLYMFSVTAKSILPFTRVPRREVGQSNSYYQRALSTNRLAEIKKFIDKKDGSFVNSIVFHLPDDAYDFKLFRSSSRPKIKRGKKQPPINRFNESVSPGVLTLTAGFRSCFLIDGQHRLYSFVNSEKDALLPISAVTNVTDKQASRYFIDINDKAKRVDKNLLMDVEAEFDADTIQGKLSVACKILNSKKNSQIFHNNIKIPGTSIKGSLRLGGLCRVLEKLEFHAKVWIKAEKKSILNPCYSDVHSKHSQKLANVIAKYFNDLSTVSDNEAIEILMRSNGFISLNLALLRKFLIYGKKTQRKQAKHFFKVIADAYGIRKDARYARTNASRLKAALSSDASIGQKVKSIVIEISRSNQFKDFRLLTD